MIKSIISYILGFMGGFIFLLAIVNQINIAFALLVIFSTFILSLFISNKIHIVMKNKYRKQHDVRRFCNEEL